MPTTTNYIWDEQNYLVESDGTNTINVVYTNEPQQYGNLVSTRISGTTSYHHFDATGSTRQLTILDRKITDSAVYDASGIVVSRSGPTQFRLTWIGVSGYYSDPETDWCYIRRRTYSATIARWASIDPLEFGDGANRFIYCLNCPIVFTDESGAAVAPYIRIDPKGDTLARAACGTANAPLPGALLWNYFIFGGAPCDGYIVQKVEMRCQVRKCIDCPSEPLPSPTDGPATLTFFEAFKYKEKANLPIAVVNNTVTFTDASRFAPRDGTCGYRAVFATLKFFCKDTNAANGLVRDSQGTDDLGDVDQAPTDPASLWGQMKDHKAGDCEASSGFTPSTNTEPAFWSTPAIIDDPSRWTQFWWNCCCAKLVDATGNPSLLQH